MLGYRLSLVNGQITVGLGDKAYGGLEKALQRAHLTDSPSNTAKMVVRGWLRAVGPAVESVGAMEIVGRVRGIAAQYGFRELGRVTELEDELVSACQQWSCYRNRLSSEENSSMGE